MVQNVCIYDVLCCAMKFIKNFRVFIELSLIAFAYCKKRKDTQLVYS